MRAVSTVVLILLTYAAASVGGQDKAQMKEQQAKAKAIVKEAKALEKSGHLVEARKEYAQSQALFDTKDAEKGIQRIDQKLQKEVKQALSEAQKLYERNQFHEAATRLEQALPLGTWSSVLSRDLTLCYYRQGDAAKAAEYLDQDIAGTPDPRAREKLLELRTVVTTGEAVPALNKEQRQSIAEFDLAASRLGFGANLDDPSGQKEEGTPAGGDPPAGSKAPAKAARISSPCMMLETLKSDLGGSASAAFDLANCAETNARPREATKFLQRYIELAPKALDRDDVRVRQGELQELLNLPGENADRVSKLYASSSRSIQEGKYDQGFADLLKAEALAPDLPLTKWRLALLYEAMGNVGQARSYFNQYQQMNHSPNDQQSVAFHLASLDTRRAKYDEEVGAARDVMADLFRRALNLNFNQSKGSRPLRAQTAKGNTKKANKEVGGFAVPYGYAQEQLKEAGDHLQLALALFPLGAGANELMGLVYLQANDGQSAMRCFDAIASQGLPVAFYAECRGHKLDHAARCELSRTGARLIFLSSYDKKGRPRPPAYPASEDGLGDLILAPTAKRQDQFDALTLTSADIKHVETKNGLVRVKLAGQEQQEITLSPIFLPSFTPIQGPPARRFANTYTRLFMRYPGLEDSKLGTEGLSGMEKVKLAANITETAMEIGASVAFGGVAAYSAIEGAEGVLSTARQLNQTMNSLHVNLAGWEKLVSEQQNLLVGVPFKSIPTEPPNLAYVSK